MKGDLIDFDSIKVLSMFEVLDYDDSGRVASTSMIEVPKPKQLTFSGTIELDDLVKDSKQDPHDKRKKV